MKIFRPYIPLAVRVLVAERQMRAAGNGEYLTGPGWPLARRLQDALHLLFADQPCHLDHDPALVNRPFNKRTGKYTPDANDPTALVYRTKTDHEIKTRVRGVGAQRSDLGQARYNKKVARNREKRLHRPKQAVSRKTHPGSSGFPISSDKSKPKRKWASRPLQSASRWRKRPLKDAGRKVPYGRPRKTPVTLPRLSIQDDRP